MVKISTRRPIVQKFGGSSLSTPTKVRAVAEKVARAAQGGRPLVVVVSAMGDTTSSLIAKAHGVAQAPPAREMDVLLTAGERVSMALLSMAIQDLGRPAISLTGPQCGILTDARHSNATIVDVQPERVQRELDAGRIVVVAGYQGASAAGEITTLGRGGSDTTAVALAAALGVDTCEIYSDVPGVYTADPRMVDGALHLRRVDSLAMSEYSRHGAGVLHRECVLLARRHGVSIRALSTFGDDTHTLVGRDLRLEYSEAPASASPIVGIASRKRRVRVLANGRDARTLARVAGALEGVERISAPAADGGLPADFLVSCDDVGDADAFAADLAERVRSHATVTAAVASITAVSCPADARRTHASAVELLRGCGVQVAASYPDALSTTIAVSSEDRRDAVRALHRGLVENALGAARAS